MYISRGIFNLGAVPTETARLLQEGVEAACREYDWTLVSFTLNDFDKPQYQYFYDIAPRMRADGALVWISNSNPALPPYLDSFAPTPLVGIGLPASCVHTKVDIGNRAGMRELMEHLITVHGLTKFAVIRGPLGHPYSEERFAAYQEALAAHQLVFDPRKSFVATNWFSQEAFAAIDHFFGTNEFQAGKDIQAILCANDRIAHMAINALRARKLEVPRDLVVCGFNNQMEAQICIPSITSVTVPLRDQAFQAVRILSGKLGGAAVPAQTFIDSRLAIHESCGCLNEHLIESEPGLDKTLFRLEQRLRQAGVADARSRAENLIRGWEQTFSSGDPAPLMEELRGLMLERPEQGAGMLWQDCLSDLSGYAPHPAILDKTRIMVNDYGTRTIDPLNSSNLFERENLLKLETLLTQCTEMDQLRAVLRESLPTLNLAACHLLLFSQAVRQDCPLPSSVLHTFAFKRGESGPTPSLKGPLAWAELLPALVHQNPEIRHFNLWPLISGSDSFGLVVFGMGDISVQSREAITSRLSSVVASITLLDELRTKSADLEQSIVKLENTRDALFESEKMAALGRLVAGLAHEVNTPLGIAVTANSFAEVNCRNILEMLSNPSPQKGRLIALVQDVAASTDLTARNLRRAADLITDFKKISVDAHMEETSLVRVVDLLENIVRSLAVHYRSGQHHVQVKGPRDMMIRTFAMSVAQVITHLIMNSLIHGFEDRPGGSIGIEASPTDEGILIRYCDDGRGMDDLVLKRMYEPFFTTRRGRGGTGLGLSIVHALVEQRLGGSITCRSNPGEGVEFSVRIANQEKTRSG